MATLTWTATQRFYSYLDELHFFTWLESITDVEKVVGENAGLVIHLRSPELSEESLRDLCALYARYKGNMKELKQFSTPENEHWFKNPKAYWYKGVFGDSKIDHG